HQNTRLHLLRPRSPYTTLFRSYPEPESGMEETEDPSGTPSPVEAPVDTVPGGSNSGGIEESVETGEETALADESSENTEGTVERSEEHTSELQSRFDLVCRLLL